MKLVLDTNAYCHCQNQNETVLRNVSRAQFLYLPIVVYAELYYGFKNGNRFSDNMDQLKKFIEQFNVDCVEINQDIAERFAEILLHLKKKGKPIPTNDVWIAATTMSLGGTLLTADAHFSHLPQIRVENI